MGRVAVSLGRVERASRSGTLDTTDAVDHRRRCRLSAPSAPSAHLQLGSLLALDCVPLRCIQSDLNASIDTSARTREHTHTHTHTHARNVLERARTHISARVYTFTCTNRHTTQARPRALTHRHTHTERLACTQARKRIVVERTHARRRAPQRRRGAAGALT